jgi:hypothetical protein
VSVYNFFNCTFAFILICSSPSKSRMCLAAKVLVRNHILGHSDTDSDIDVDAMSTEIIGDMATDCDNRDDRYISIIPSVTLLTAIQLQPFGCEQSYVRISRHVQGSFEEEGPPHRRL